MLHALGGAITRRGSIYLKHKVEFDQVIKAKFFVVLEDYEEGMENIIVAFTTSRTEFAYRDTAVLVERGVFEEFSDSTLIDLNNYREISIEDLFSSGCKYIGQLPETVMQEVDEAIEHLQDVDEVTWFRMIGIS